MHQVGQIEVDRILELVEGQYGTQLVELGHAGKLTSLRKLQDQYRAAMDELAPADLVYGRVRAASATAQNYLLRVVLRIGAHYDSVSEGDVRARQALLAPIKRQHAWIGELLRQRRPVTDVDPATGEKIPVDPDEEPSQDAISA